MCVKVSLHTRVFNSDMTVTHEFHLNLLNAEKDFLTTGSPTAGQENPLPLWNSKVHYVVHKTLHWGRWIQLTPSHLPHIPHVILLDFINLIYSVKEYKLKSSSLYNFWILLLPLLARTIQSHGFFPLKQNKRVRNQIRPRSQFRNINTVRLKLHTWFRETLLLGWQK
jgi:hypothetical protein